MSNDNHNLDANREPLTGAPGAHPVGTGLGAAIGAVVGGLAGKGVAEAIDPTRESAYWSENFSGRDYVEHGSSFDDVESEMSSDWATNRGASSLSWERARHAARDAWNRISPSGG